MNISMLSPRLGEGGRGRGHPQEIDIEGCHLGQEFDNQMVPQAGEFDIAMLPSWKN